MGEFLHWGKHQNDLNEACRTRSSLAPINGANDETKKNPSQPNVKTEELQTGDDFRSYSDTSYYHPEDLDDESDASSYGMRLEYPRLRPTQGWNNISQLQDTDNFFIPSNTGGELLNGFYDNSMKPVGFPSLGDPASFSKLEAADNGQSEHVTNLNDLVCIPHLFPRNSLTQDFSTMPRAYGPEGDTVFGGQTEAPPSYQLVSLKADTNSTLHNYYRGYNAYDEVTKNIHGNVQNFTTFNSKQRSENKVEFFQSVPKVEHGVSSRHSHVFSFEAEFANREQWKGEYQRNNRNGGMKNIRCFPYCGSRHYTGGFCGESVILKLTTNCPAQNIYAYAEITLFEDSDDMDLTLKGGAQQAFVSSVRVGTCLSKVEVCEKLRTREQPFRDWWSGDLRETKELLKPNVSHSIRASHSVERHMAFEFNRLKRGWHYGWVANKYISDSLHCVRAYIFVPIEHTSSNSSNSSANNNAGESESLKCVYIAKGPAFKLFSRKPKRDSTEFGEIETESKCKHASKKVKRKSSAEFSKLLPFNKNGDLAEKLVEVTSNLPAPQKAEDSSNNSIERDMNWLLESENKGFVRFVQKLLLLTPEDMYNTLTDIHNRTTDVDASAEGFKVEEEELKALKAFAQFMLSDNENLTAEIQSKLEKLDPFDSKRKKKSVKTKAKEIIRLARCKFDRFLSTFNLNVDIFGKTESFKAGIVAGGALEEQIETTSWPTEVRTFEEHFVKTSLDYQDEKSFENQIKAELLKPIHTYRTTNDETDESLDVLKTQLKLFQGTWFSSSQTLKSYDEIYTRMFVPFALKKCYLCITGSFTIDFEFVEEVSKIKMDDSVHQILENSDDSSSAEENKTPVLSLIFHYNPKLFSTGIVKYELDGKMKPWPLVSPLISTKYDAIAMRAFIKNRTFGNNDLVVHVEHIYREHKILRSLKLNETNRAELVGEVKLFEKSVDHDQYIEWTEVYRGPISFSM